MNNTIHIFLKVSCLFSLLLISACQSNTTDAPKETPQAKKAAPAIKLDPTLTERPRIALVPHYFSNQEKTDNFRLMFNEPDPLLATATLSIRNGKGKIIYRERFPATALLDDGLNNHVRDKKNIHPDEKRRYILNRMATFFTDDKFTTDVAAVIESPEFVLDGLDKEVLKNPNAVVFTYSLYKEGKRAVAYIPSMEEAKLFYNCC